jgi:hypothetical protein
MIILLCVGLALLSGIVCFTVEKSERIHLHIDRHHDALLAGLTGATVTLFALLVLNIILHYQNINIL